MDSSGTSQVEEGAGRTARWWRTAGEFALLIVAVAIALKCAHFESQRKPLWMDELVSYEEATDPSLTNVLSAIRHMDGNPPLHPLLLRAWVGTFGDDPWSMRQPSAFALALALVVCWILTRSRFGFWPATLATFTVFLTPHDMLVQWAEARYYGVLLLLFALAIALWDRIARTDRAGLLLLATNAVVHAALVLTHTFGGLYAFAAATALVIVDVGHGRRRPRTWLAYCAGWAAFLPWIPSLLQQRQLGIPHGWIRMPGRDAILDAFNYGLNDCLPVIVLLAAGAIGLNRNRRVSDDTDGSRALVVLGLSVVLLPPLVTLAASALVVPVFLPRYFLPGLLGVLVLLAALLSRAGLRRVSGRGATVLLFLAVSFTLTTPGRRLMATSAPWDAAVAERYAKILDAGLPVLTEDAQVYLPFRHHHAADDLWLVLDWESALDPQATPSAVNNHKMMKAMAAHYPRHNVIEGRDALERWDRFHLIEIDWYRWSERHLHGRDDWKLTHVDLNVFLVERRP